MHESEISNPKFKVSNPTGIDSSHRILDFKFRIGNFGIVHFPFSIVPRNLAEDATYISTGRLHCSQPAATTRPIGSFAPPNPPCMFDTSVKPALSNKSAAY